MRSRYPHLAMDTIPQQQEQSQLLAASSKRSIYYHPRQCFSLDKCMVKNYGTHFCDGKDYNEQRALVLPE